MNTKLPPLRDALRRQLAAIHLRDWLPSRGNLFFTLLVALCLIAATTSGVLAAPQRMAAQSGTSTATIPYQGRLADASGAPLTGTYILTFRLYNVASGGSPLWEEIWIGANNVQVANGLFSVMLGSITPIPQAMFTSNSSLWLGIDVGTDPEMTPRVQLGSVSFAMQAQHAERANGLSAPAGDPPDAVIVDNDGKVGIGTTSPAYLLDINGNMRASTATLSGFTKLRVYASTQLITSNVYTKVVFGTKNFDTLNEYNTSTGLTTIQQTGYYFIHTNIAWGLEPGPFAQRVQIYKNGSDLIAQDISGGSPAGLLVNQVNTLAYLTAGDSIEIHVFQNCGVGLNVLGDAAGSFLEIFRIP